MVIFRFTAVTDGFCCLRIESTCILCFPVEDAAGIRHLVIDITRMWDSFCNISCVSSDLGSNDSLLGVIYVWKCKVFSRCDIAQECGSAHSCNCSTNCGCDMIISGSDICYQRSKYIERCTHADALLYFHVRSNLIQRHMSRTFYHNLYIVIPCTLGQFSEADEFFNLAHISSVSKTSRTTGITKGNGNIIFFADVEDFIVMLIEWVLFSGHAHPCKDKTSATAYDVHFTFMLFDLFDGFSCDSTVKSDKVNAILCVKTDNINKILCSKSCQVSLIMNDTVIDRYSSNHNRALMCQFLTEWLGIAVAGKIHNCFCTEINGTHNFLHFNIIIFAVAGNA